MFALDPRPRPTEEYVRVPLTERDLRAILELLDPLVVQAGADSHVARLETLLDSYLMDLEDDDR